VTDAAFSPDGQLVLTCGDDGTARLWDVATSKPVATFRHENEVMSAHFSRDGRLLLTASKDGTARLWDVVSPAPDDAARLRAWVRARTRKGFDDRGVLQKLSTEEWLRAWQELDTRGGDWEAQPDLRRWHFAQASEAEARKDWFAATFHLSRLLDKDPDNSDVLGRRGEAYANRGQWKEAMADYERALALRPDDVPSRRGRARVNAELRHWDAAVADLEQALRLNPEDPTLWYGLGMAYLGRQDVAAYREHCRRMLERFGQTKDPEAADWTGWLAVVLPDAVPDHQALVRLAEGAYESQSDNGSYLETLGAALFRAGRYAEAIERLKEAARRQKGGSVWTQLFLAMAHLRQGQLTAGAAALGRPCGTGGLLIPAALLSGNVAGRGWLDKARKQAADSSAGWGEQVRRQYLFAEAEALQKSGQP
jgi:tetratricopeptide (TPR) repeat protein